MVAISDTTLKMLSSSSSAMSEPIINSSTHSNASSSSFSQCGSRGKLVSITVRKDKDNTKMKAGIQLEQDSTGQVTVTNIAKNGLFGDCELEIGDVILSVNRRRLSQGEGPDVLMKVVHKYDKISIAVRKNQSKPSLGKETNTSNKSKTTKKKSSKQVEDENNNNSKVDTYYAGLAKHNDDGSLMVERKNDQQKKKTSAAAIITVTISAEKKIKKNKSKSNSTSKSSSSSSSSSKSSVGVVLEISNRNNKKQLVVANILPKSIFESTKLQVGDKLLSINDMSFRDYADAEYAMTIMENARLMVTLVVEQQNPKGKQEQDRDDSTSSPTESIISTSTHSSNNSVSSSSSSSSSSSHSFCSKSRSSKLKSEYDYEIETEFKIEKYRPVTITVPKSYMSQNVGLVFRLVKTAKAGNVVFANNSKNNSDEKTKTMKHDGGRRRTWVYVDNILDDSIFKQTSLKKGDKVISINDVDFANNESDLDTRLAYKTCVQSKEFVTMVVLKDDESIYKEKGFCFDNSITNLDWKV